MKKRILLLTIFIFIISLFLILKKPIENITYIIKKVIEPPNIALINDEKNIRQIIMKKYPTYEIIYVDLSYSDWSSSLRDADEEHKATSATVIIENELEQRTIHLNKYFYRWKISSDEPDYGTNVPEDIYFLEITYNNFGKAVQFDITKTDWIFPDEFGNYYHKVGKGDDWYYSYKYCKNIYKTKKGIIYVFNKEKANWEETDISYSTLSFLSNYTKVDKEYAIDFIEKNSSYRENDN